MSTQHEDLADDVMCHCSGTTRGEIQRLAALGKDMDAISRWTGALSGCGGCEWDIADLLNEFGARVGGETSSPAA